MAVGGGTTAAASATAAATATDPVVAVGGGIACIPGATPTATRCRHAATGNAVGGVSPAFVLPLGDTQYDSGTEAEYAGSYAKTVWGADKGISRPAAGNHEYAPSAPRRTTPISGPTPATRARALLVEASAAPTTPSHGT